MSDSEKREFKLTEYEPNEDGAEDVTEEPFEEQEDMPSEHRHHHRHHSKAYYQYRRKKHKVKKFLKKHHLNVMIPVLLAAVLVIVAVVMILHTSSPQQKVKPNTSGSNTAVVDVASNSRLSLSVSNFSAPQLLVDDVVLDFVGSDSGISLYEMLSSKGDITDVHKAKSVTLALQINSLPSDIKVAKATAELSENKDFRSSEVLDITNTNGTADFGFLKTGMRYYYRMTVETDNGNTITNSGCFDTEPSPRLINLDGVVNVRDIGGWHTEDGHTIKQGVLYRGPEIDGAYDKYFLISDKGISDAHKYLGIVTDFDLRGLTVDVPKDSAFGITTKHIIYDAYDYDSVFTAASADYLKSLFSDLADKSNYPAYIHCSYGLDRTGTACYLLEALLGLSEADLSKEFELSVLSFASSNPYAPENKYNDFLAAFQQLSGNSPREKAENYLRTCGVTDEQIQQIKDIFLE